VVPCIVLAIGGAVVFAGPSSGLAIGIALMVVSGAALVIVLSVIGAAGTYARR
jgi:hypothetical protein